MAGLKQGVETHPAVSGNLIYNASLSGEIQHENAWTNCKRYKMAPLFFDIILCYRNELSATLKYAFLLYHFENPAAIISFVHIIQNEMLIYLESAVML